MGFDFPRWRDWTETQGRNLRVAAPEFQRNDEHMPGFGLGLLGGSALGSFRCYSNGFVDFEVIDKRSNTLAANKTMIEVSDENFISTFETFVREFEKVH